MIIKKCDLAVEVTCLRSIPSTQPASRNLWRICQEIKLSKFTLFSRLLHLLGLLLLLVNVSHASHHLLHRRLLYLHLHPDALSGVLLLVDAPVKALQTREFSARVSDSSRRYRGCRVFIVQQTRESFGERGSISRLTLVFNKINYFSEQHAGPDILVYMGNITALRTSCQLDGENTSFSKNRRCCLMSSFNNKLFSIHSNGNSADMNKKNRWRLQAFWGRLFCLIFRHYKESTINYEKSVLNSIMYLHYSFLSHVFQFYGSRYNTGSFYAQCI